eukprot:1161346-Pelagomonas_calceolata.AAC.5
MVSNAWAHMREHQGALHVHVVLLAVVILCACNKQTQHHGTSAYALQKKTTLWEENAEHSAQQTPDSWKLLAALFPLHSMNDALHSWCTPGSDSQDIEWRKAQAKKRPYSPSTWYARA